MRKAISLGFVVFVGWGFRWTLADEVRFDSPTAPSAPRSSTAIDANQFSKPLSLVDALSIAELRNGSVLHARKAVEVENGVALQTRVVALPKVRATGGYQISDRGAQESFVPGFPKPNEQSWNTGIHVIQPLYEGGRVRASLRSSRLIRELALRNFETVLADTIQAVRIAYADTLLAREQIGVQEASLKLLGKELEDTRRRFEAGTTPQFNVLRAETELGNARPRLIHARNASRIARQNLMNLLGQRIPNAVGEDIPLELSGNLNVVSVEVELSSSLVEAMENRSELAASRIAQRLRGEELNLAKAGSRPRVELFGGYGARSPQFDRNLGAALAGWQTGAQVSWDLWDGGMTRGKIQEAQAKREQADIAVDDLMRRVELEVRTAYSNFTETREVLTSQQRVTHTAEEALRLVNSRAEAGAAIQLDVLSAQTSLTEARTIFVQATRDYSVALTRLERACGRLVTRAIH